MKLFRVFRCTAENPLPAWQDALFKFLTDAVVIFLLVFLIIRPFFVAPFQVQQRSMEPNVHDGEYIFVAKLPYNRLLGWRDYARGEVVVFKPSGGADYLIKRIIGLPGEDVRLADGSVWVRATESKPWQKLDDSFLATKNRGNTCPVVNGLDCDADGKQTETVWHVPEGEYFVLGDNRTESRDSRQCFSGVCNAEEDHFIIRSRIEGRAWVVFFPFGGLRSIGTQAGL